MPTEDGRQTNDICLPSCGLGILATRQALNLREAILGTKLLPYGYLAKEFNKYPPRPLTGGATSDPGSTCWYYQTH